MLNYFVLDDDENDCDKEKYKTCLGCTVGELSCEWCNGDCQYIGTCNSAQVSIASLSLSLIITYTLIAVITSAKELIILIIMNGRTAPSVNTFKIRLKTFLSDST